MPQKKKEHGKKENAPHCERCLDTAGIDMLMRRAYQRVDNQWLPLGWYCPNCFSFDIDESIKEARNKSREVLGEADMVRDKVVCMKINAKGEEVIDEEMTKKRAKEWAKVNIMLQRIYQKK